MPQISLYIDRVTLEKVEHAAEAENISISGWVGRQIKKSLSTDYPKGFENLFGSIDDETFDVSDSGSFEQDVQREGF
jgi:hypothetical protein